MKPSPGSPLESGTPPSPDAGASHAVAAASGTDSSAADARSSSGASLASHFVSSVTAVPYPASACSRGTQL